MLNISTTLTRLSHVKYFNDTDKFVPLRTHDFCDAMLPISALKWGVSRFYYVAVAGFVTLSSDIIIPIVPLVYIKL